MNCENCAQRFSSLDKLENHRKQPCEHLPCEIEHSHESHRLNKTFKTKPEALAYVETKVGDFLVLLENEGIYQCKFAAYGCESKIKILPVEDGKKFLVLGCLFHEQHGGKRRGGMLSQGAKRFFSSPKKKTSGKQSAFETEIRADMRGMLGLFEEQMKNMKSLGEKLKEQYLSIESRLSGRKSSPDKQKKTQDEDSVEPDSTSETEESPHENTKELVQQKEKVQNEHGDKNIEPDSSSETESNHNVVSKGELAHQKEKVQGVPQDHTMETETNSTTALMEEIDLTQPSPPFSVRSSRSISEHTLSNENSEQEILNEDNEINTYSVDGGHSDLGGPIGHHSGSDNDLAGPSNQNSKMVVQTQVHNSTQNPVIKVPNNTVQVNQAQVPIANQQSVNTMPNIKVQIYQRPSVNQAQVQIANQQPVSKVSVNKVQVNKLPVNKVPVNPGAPYARLFSKDEVLSVMADLEILFRDEDDENRDHLRLQCQTLSERFFPFNVPGIADFKYDLTKFPKDPIANDLLRANLPVLADDYMALRTYADGSCMINAVAMQIWGTDEFADELRLRLAVYVILHEDQLLEDVRMFPWGQLVNATKKKGISHSIASLLLIDEHLDALAIHALANMLDIGILSVVPLVRGATNIFDVSSGFTQYNVKSKTKYREATIFWCSTLDWDSEEFFLNHFTALVPKIDHVLEERAKRASKSTSASGKENSASTSASAKENSALKSTSAKENHSSTIEAIASTSASAKESCASMPTTTSVTGEQYPTGFECEYSQEDLDNMSECSSIDEMQRICDNIDNEENEINDTNAAESPFKSMVIEDKVVRQSDENVQEEEIKDKTPERTFEPEGLKSRKFEKHSGNKFLPYYVTLPFLANVVDGEDGVYLDRQFPPTGKKLGKKMIHSCSDNLEGWRESQINPNPDQKWKADYNDDYGATFKVLTEIIVVYHNRARNTFAAVDAVQFSDDATSLVPKYESRPPKKDTYKHLPIEDCFRIKITRHYYEGFRKKTTECFSAPEQFQLAVGRAFVEYSDGDESKTRKAHGNTRKPFKVSCILDHLLNWKTCSRILFT